MTNSIQCPTCGDDFEPPHRQTKYCSSRCKYKTKDLKRGFPCARCGEQMQRGPGSLPSGQGKHQNCERLFNPEAKTHGTVRGYRNGCRCEECRAAKNQDVRRYAARRKARDGVSPTAQSKRRKRGVDPLEILVPAVRAEGKRPKFRIAPAKRLAIYERDGWICWLCKLPVDPGLHWKANGSATLDHLIPQSFDSEPDHSPANLKLAHRWCNGARGAGGAMDMALLRARAAEMFGGEMCGYAENAVI